MKYLLALVISVLLFTSVFAQTDETTNNYSAHGIQFQIGSNFQLESFDGLTFSYLYRANKDYFFRFGIGTFLSLLDASTTAGQTDTLETEGSADGFGLTLSGDFIFTLLRKNGFSMIAGGGPFVAYRYERNYSNIVSSFDPTEVTITKNEWSAGLGLLIGAQFELNENIVFSGEYGLNVGYQSAAQDVETKQNDHNGNITTDLKKIETNSFNISNSAFRFGVAVYF